MMRVASLESHSPLRVRCEIGSFRVSQISSGWAAANAKVLRAFGARLRYVSWPSMLNRQAAGYHEPVQRRR